MSKIRQKISSIFINFIQKKNADIILYNDYDRKEINILINRIRKENELRMTNTEAQLLFNFVKATGKIKGDIAEVGVFRGASSKIICEAKGDKKLFLFDTFQGLPELSKYDNNDTLWEGQASSNIDFVRTYLENYTNVFIYKGIFPETAGPIERNEFSLINMDVDLYKSTYDCLEFFYPRMTRGGMMISHDYPYIAGVKKAIDEFFMDKPETILMMPGSQCIIIKL